MFLIDWTPVARSILAFYPAPLQRNPLVTLGNNGGFSGAHLWRLGEDFCLRASPPLSSKTELAAIHRLLFTARQEGLPFVPTILATLEGSTVIEQAGRLWALMDWMPGRASYQESPSRLKLQSACTALARLHLCFGRRHGSPRPVLPPAISRRLQAATRTLPDKATVKANDPSKPSSRTRHASSALPDRETAGTLLHPG